MSFTDHGVCVFWVERRFWRGERDYIDQKPRPRVPDIFRRCSRGAKNRLVFIEKVNNERISSRIVRCTEIKNQRW